MKIMFFVGSMILKGGTERVISNLANFLCKENEVSLVTIVNTDIAYKIDDRVKKYALDKNKTEIKEIQSKSLLLKLKKIPKYLSRVFVYRKMKKNINPDIVVAFLPHACYIALINKIFDKKSVIISVRNDPKVEYNSKIQNKLMKFLYPKVSGAVFQTDEAKDYFKDIINVETKVIPNPINTSFVQSSYLDKREKSIVTVGRLEEQKNHVALIRAFKSIASKYPDYNLIIYGEGSLRESLEQLINELQLQNRVFLPGTYNNIKEKIYKASMFVLSSKYEGMPNALMEAMALGIPVIATDCPCGGPKFLIQNNRNGILVKNGDVNQIAEAMSKIIQNPNFARNIGICANEIAEDLSPQKINKEWECYIKATYEKNKK